MTRRRRILVTLAALLLLSAAGCGRQRAPTASKHRKAPTQTIQSERPTTSAPTFKDVGIVNGCDALQSIYQGFCAAAPSELWQGSDALVERQQVVVGETIDVHGAVGVDANGKPVWADVFIRPPSGKTTLLPVDSRGGYSQVYTFSEQGEYAFGPGSWSQDTSGASFLVAYRAVPPEENDLATLFPSSQQSSWPGISVAAVPFGEKGSLRVRFVDAQGDPAQNVTLTGTQMRTDSSGYAEVPYDVTTPGFSVQCVYGNLCLQTVLHVFIANGKVSGFYEMQPDGKLVSVRTLAVNGTWLANAADFLQAMWLQTSSSGSVSTFSNGGATVRLDAQTGAVSVTKQSGSGASPPSQPVSVHPVVSGGQVYLSLSDLAKIVNLVAWAQPQPDGSLLLTDVSMP